MRMGAYNPGCVIGPDKSQIARFAEMYLDRSEFTVKIDFPDACFSNQLFQLIQHA